MRSVLVTGANGAIGQHVMRAFAVCPDMVAVALPRITWDLTQPLPERMQVSSIDAILHLAARVDHTGAARQWPEPYWRDNINMAITVAELARRRRIPVVMMSSYVYGRVPWPIPVHELVPPAPHNPYAHSKFLAEEILRSMAADFDIPVTVLRLFSPYGPGVRNVIAGMVWSAMESQRTTGRRVVNVGSPEMARDWLHVDDVAIAAVLACRTPQSGYSIYNLGYDVDHSITTVRDVADTLGAVINVREELRHDRSDIPGLAADTRKFRRTFGWEPTVELADGVRSMMNTISAPA